MKTGKFQKFQRMCDREFGKLNPVAVFPGGGWVEARAQEKGSSGGISYRRNSWVHGKR